MNFLKNNNAPIGLFDSGVGGLTVLKCLKEILPEENYVYYGDTVHMPYGDKSKSQLLEYSENILKYFETRGCKAVVMACNTTSSNIFDEVKGKYNFKLYSIVHCVSEILSTLPITKLGIFATRATVESGAYQNLITKFNPEMKVFAQYCPKWVHIVENNLLNEETSVATIKSDLERMMLNQPEKILLGCTHYPFLLNILSKYTASDNFIDPAIYFAQYIKNDLASKNLLSNEKTQTDEFFVSSNPQNFKSAAKLFYELKQEPKVLVF